MSALRNGATMLVIALLLSGAAFSAPRAYAAEGTRSATAAGGHAPDGDRNARDWSQAGHDASRTGRSGAKGPRWPELVDGWPVRCENCGNGISVAELDGPTGKTTRRAVFSGSYWSPLLSAFDAEGVPLAGWPVELEPEAAPGYGGLSQPAIGGRGQTRIFTTLMGGGRSGSPPGTAFGLRPDGRSLPGEWPVRMPRHQAIAEAALTEEARSGQPGDDREEVLYVPASAGSYAGQLHALRPDGSERAGWPVTMGMTIRFNDPAVGPDGTVYALGSYCWTPFAGLLCWQVDAYAPDGERKEGWPFGLTGYNASYSGLSVDGQGTAYLGVSSHCSSTAYYLALTPDGTLKPGFPVEVTGVVYDTPAIAADGTTYVPVYDCSDPEDLTVAIYAFDREGRPRPGWPVRRKTRLDELGSGVQISNIALGADGTVFFGSRSTVYGYDSGGEPLAGWPVDIDYARHVTSLALANDGTLYAAGRAPPSFREKNAIYAFREGEPASGDLSP